MATQDVKAALPVARLGSGESPIKWSRNRLTFGAASGSIDVATDIYEIGDIKAESALVDGYVIVTTVIPTTSSSPTLQFHVGTKTSTNELTAILPMSNIAKGTTFRFHIGDWLGAAPPTVGIANLYVDADAVLNVTHTGALPASGAIDVYWATIDIQDNT